MTAADPLPPREIVARWLMWNHEGRYTVRDANEAAEKLLALLAPAPEPSDAEAALQIIGEHSLPQDDVRFVACVTDAVARVRQAERERAAGIADYWLSPSVTVEHVAKKAIAQVAAAIRAGEKP